ncbi:hypothetical protein ACT009_01385 [Sphingomonas sp. Tas61C01]|uniref:hypothetical protein n=1 Tax=Sphingomonas sp. Tas61C01 TaxID=3458297 RepID=UPI00403EE9AD
MRALITLLVCMMLVVTAWGSVAQAAAPTCAETTNQMAVHAAGDCDEVPADADRNYPHCHTGCHGHHVAAPVPAGSLGQASATSFAYAPAAHRSLDGHRIELTLRPPQA